MFCPVCGQQQVSEETRFCSRCGFLLTGVTQVIGSGGALPQAAPDDVQAESPRKRGIKKGVMIMLVGCLLIVPLLAIFHVATNTEPFAVAIAAILSFWGGILRMLYAWMFESKYASAPTLEEKVVNAARNLTGKNQNQTALPPSHSIPVDAYAPPPRQGNWRETNDLASPAGSVTDSTTKLLQNEPKDS